MDVDAFEKSVGKLLEMPAVHVPDISPIVKSLDKDHVGGYLHIWGSPDQLDLDGEYFSPETQGIDFAFKAAGAIPGFYHHAMDPVFKNLPTGRVDIMHPDDKGVWIREKLFTPDELVDLDLWAESQIDLAAKYMEAIRKLVNKGILFWSSGTLPGAREVARDGHILRWTDAEATATISPSAVPTGKITTHIDWVQKAYNGLGLDFAKAVEACKLDGTCELEDRGAEDARRMASEVDVSRLRLELLKLSE